MKLFKSLIVITIVLIVNACGGGGGGGGGFSDSPNSAPPVISMAANENALFSSDPLMLPDFSSFFPCIDPYIAQVIPIDLNKDGRMDLMVMMFCSNPNVPVGYDGPTENSIVVFLQNTDGSFRIGNHEIFKTINQINIGGAVRRYVIADFNSDNYPDIAIAVNREDLRPGSQPWNNWTSQAAFIVSNGDGTYRVDKVDPKAYYHNVTLIQYEPNKFEALFHSSGNDLVGNPTPAVAFRNIDNKWVQQINAYPGLQGATITALPLKKGETSTNLFTAVWSWPSIALYRRSGLSPPPSPAWSKISEINFYPDASTNKFLVGDQYFNYLIFWESCAFKLYPDGNDNLAFLTAPDESPYQPFIFYSVINEKLIPISSIIEGETPYFNTYYFQCEDVNKDGFDDIFMSRKDNRTYGAFTHAKPAIYLNNKKGKLITIDDKYIPSIPDRYGQSSARFVDINGDGIRDLIYWSEGGADGSHRTAINGPVSIYKGLKQVSLPN
jgi:hypothetical protein